MLHLHAAWCWSADLSVSADEFDALIDLVDDYIYLIDYYAPEKRASHAMRPCACDVHPPAASARSAILRRRCRTLMHVIRVCADPTAPSALRWLQINGVRC